MWLSIFYSFRCNQRLLILCDVLSKKSSKIKVLEHWTYFDDDIQKKAFAIQSALASSMRCLQAMHKRKLNDHEIEIVINQVPRDTGTEFLGVLEYKIKELQKGNAEKKAGEKEKPKTEENEKETLGRCNAIIALIDLYCTLSCLREFVIYYLVTLFANNKVSEDIAENYQERRELFRIKRDDLLKVLYEPEAKHANVAAVFIHKRWPRLGEQLGSHLDLSDLIDRPLSVVSASDEKFGMFRCNPDNVKPFALTRFICVMENTKTEFVLSYSECGQYFKMHLRGHREYTWKLGESPDAPLKVVRRISAEESDNFNIVRLSNGNVMFSSKKRPTCFIKMGNAKDEERLGLTNKGFGENCQWKLVSYKKVVI